MVLQALKMAIRPRWNYRFRLRRGEKFVWVPVIHGVGRANRDSHEEHIFRVIEKLNGIGATSLLVDIGANIGQTLIKYMLVTGKEGRYIGFEPNAKAASYVEELIYCNRLPSSILLTWSSSRARTDAK